MFQSRLVPPKGPRDARIVIIGEAPAAYEERKLEPFVGPAGAILDRCLTAAGILRSECYITNVFKYRLYKEGEKFKDYRGTIVYTERSGFTEAALDDLEEFNQELARLNANVYVPAGNLALRAVTNVRGISKWRGSIIKDKWGRKCIPIIHPAACLQGNYLWQYYITNDLRRVKEEAEYPEIIYPEQQLKWNPNFGEVIAYLTTIRKGRRLNFDIEIANDDVSRISFAHDLSFAISIPFGNRYWSPEQEAQIWRLVAKVLGDPNVPKSNQNILFDAFVLAFRNNLVIRGRLDDPMVANHIIYPDFPKGLDFLTSIHTRIPYYKDEGKVWKNPGTGADAERRFGEYSCQDSAVSAECMVRLDQELDEQGYRQPYEMTLTLYQPLLAMMLRGMRVDKEALDKARVQITQERDKAQEELNQACGCELNPNSSKQCAEYFYVKKGIKPYISRKTGSVTTDDKALARLARGTKARPGLPEARLAQRVRAFNKLLNTYYNIQFDADDRFRSSYNPRGTTTGRLSSSETIFGTGGNAQNLPPEFRQFLIADPGYVLIEVDKVQAEWVVTAYLAQDPRMINIVESNLDAHIETAHYVTGIPRELIIADDKLVGKETNPDIIAELRQQLPDLQKYSKVPRSMSIRQGYKRANYGLNYGMGIDKFALTNDLENTEAAEMYDGYHTAYPNLRSNYYVYVQHCLSKDRTLTNCFGRPRRFLGPWGQELFNQAYDFIPQSTVVDLVNQGMVRIYQDTSECLLGLELLAHGHDSLTFQYPLRNKGSLGEALSIILTHMNPELTYFGRTFHIRSDVKIGFNWRDMKSLTADVSIERSINELSRG